MKLRLYVLWIRFKARYLFWTKLYKQHHHELNMMKSNSEHLKWTIKTWGSHKNNNKDKA